MIAEVSTRKPLGQLEPGLPASWYHDPAHYHRELESFWYGRWIAVAREEEFARPGDWRVIRLHDQSILLVRSPEGLKAFHNTCRHRGSVLCTGERGTFPRGRIVCPYHAWTYDLEGRLVATPRRMETPDFRLEDFPLHALASGTWGGFVFVNVDGNAVPLSSQIEHVKKRFARYGFASLKIGKRIVTDVKANWKLLCENFSECFHCPPVHPELCRVVSAYRQAGAWGLDEAHTVGPEYAPAAQTLTLDGSSRLPAFSGLNEIERQTIYAPEMLPPNLFLNVHPDYVNAHMMFPTGPESVRIVYDWLFEPRSLPLSDDDLAHYVTLWDITNRQDARNCEWQQEGVHARAFAHGVYVPQEFDVHRFAQWVREGLEGARP
ncbi:MAG TPA: aromatic ring-hydroxylating dioxygenase subunit alpha [Burkholderiales bacterium]|nr:aromatic ring-hydroxylating dioxygenase subunit alpha [Burkholderiales bacterium]